MLTALSPREALTRYAARFEPVTDPRVRRVLLAEVEVPSTGDVHAWTEVEADLLLGATVSSLPGGTVSSLPAPDVVPSTGDLYLVLHGEQRVESFRFDVTGGDRA